MAHRCSQTRILLNKADKVRAEELMRIQGSLIWNISPLMSSAEPPVIYSVSLWSNPYEIGSPARLLHSQELSFLKDIRTAIDKRVENKIASARRFAVRMLFRARLERVFFVWRCYNFYFLRVYAISPV